jgi:hypothetical protein
MASNYRVRTLDTGRDLPAVAALLESEVPAYAGVRRTAAEFLIRLEWLLLGNPHRGEYPPGWVLEAADGSISGVHLSVPRLFSGTGGLMPFFFSCYYFVKSEARGMESLGLFLSYRKLAAHGILVATSANANSAPLWQKLGGTALHDTGYERLKPLGWRPLIEEALYRRFGWRLRLGRNADLGSLMEPAPSSGFQRLVTGEEIASAASVPDSGPLQPVRSADWLSWKFGPCNQDGARLYRWDLGKAPVFVSMQRSQRGWRGQIRCLHVADAWTAGPDFGREVLNDLVSLHRRDTDALAIRGFGHLPSAARALSWRERTLAAPVLWLGAAHAARLDGLTEFYPDSGI